MQDCGALLFCGIGCIPISKAGTNHRPETSFLYLYAPVRKKFSDVFHLVGGILDHQFAACWYGEQSCFCRANAAVFLRCFGVPFLVFGGSDLRYSADGYRFSVGPQISGAIVCPAMDIQVYSIYVQMDSGGGQDTLDNAVLGFYQKHIELCGADDDDRHFLLAGSQEEDELPMEKLDDYPCRTEYIGADLAVLFVPAKSSF
jgi:hypothetical protein